MMIVDRIGFPDARSNVGPTRRRIRAYITPHNRSGGGIGPGRCPVRLLAPGERQRRRRHRRGVREGRRRPRWHGQAGRGGEEAEGQLNVIALPPDWANYGEIITAFTAKYGIKVNSAQPDASSQDEINAAKQLKGQGGAPDVFDLGTAVALANIAMFAPYKVATWDDIPAELKEAGGAWVNDYGGYMSIGYDAGKVPAPTGVADLLGARYKGKVALNGDPTQAGAAFNGVVAAALGNGGSADDIAKGVDFFGQLKKAGNFLPVDPTPATIESGQTPVVFDWDYLNVAQGAKLKGKVDWKTVVPRTRWSAPTTSRRSAPTRRTPRPPGCGRSSSTATRARTCGSRAAPARCGPTR